MSFTCYFCGHRQLPGVKPEKRSTKIRLIITEIVEEEDPKTKLLRVYTRTREEIAQERLACPTCAKKPNHPEVKVIDESNSRGEVRASPRLFI